MEDIALLFKKAPQGVFFVATGLMSGHNQERFDFYKNGCKCAKTLQEGMRYHIEETRDQWI
ncbi:hypothetical protein BK126_08225 [Paenibacillus sp. FSL H7-0326]|nr:hypothetical protein BK126_08225 [Paenibacillus sp. FSL H7-0326]